MRNRSPKYSVSITGDLHRKVKAYANAWQISQADVLRIVLDNVLGTKTITEDLEWYAAAPKAKSVGPFQDPKSAYLDCVSRGATSDRVSVWAQAKGVK